MVTGTAEVTRGMSMRVAALGLAIFSALRGRGTWGVRPYTRPPLKERPTPAIRPTVGHPSKFGPNHGLYVQAYALP